MKALGFGVLIVGQTVHLCGKCVGVSHVTGALGRFGVQKSGWRVSLIYLLLFPVNRRNHMHQYKNSVVIILNTSRYCPSQSSLLGTCI